MDEDGTVFIQMKATGFHFPLVLFFIMLYKMVLTFDFVNEILNFYLSKLMKATECYFPVSVLGDSIKNKNSITTVKFHMWKS